MDAKFPNVISAIEEGLAEKNSAVIVPLGWVLACVYALLALLHPFFVVGPYAWTISLAAAASSILAIYLVTRWPKIANVAKAFVFVGLLAVLALANSIGHLLVEPESFHTGNVILVFIAMGMTFLSRRWFYTLIGATIAMWSLVVVARPVPDIEPWSWYLMFATAISIVLFENRLRSERRAVQRQLILMRGGEALQYLATSSELGNGKPEIFQTICEVASVAVQVDRVSIWLVGDDDGWLVCKASYDLDSGQISSGVRIEMERHCDYLSAVNEDRLVAVSDTSIDHRFFNLGDGLARLDAAVIAEGRLTGLISFEQLSKTRTWEVEELTLATSFAEMAGTALSAIDRVRLEKKVSESQRFERMGILAGGVAHDFNNLLTVILGNADLLALEHDADEKAVKKINQIQTAGLQAADLARHMLAYSGRGFFVKEPTDLASIAEEIVSGWHRVNSEITVAKHYADTTALVDATQIGQVVLNLLTNSADADATQIDIVVDITKVEEQDINRFVLSEELDKGHYARLQVSDNGKGMDVATRDKMFDPFFTSKQTGQGLGLAAVLGIVRGHDGSISVQSERGRGTSIDVLLPLAENQKVVHAQSPETPSLAQKTLSVLVVEDRAGIRRMIRDTLSDHEVKDVSGIKGLRTALMQRRSYDVAIVDVTLDDGDGVQGIKLIRHAQENLPVVVMSGYDGGVAMTRIDNRRGVVFLRKPFNSEQLMSSIAQVIERTRLRNELN
ncbi:MAG: ATP-binding protein [Pseudomonadota bacterium]